MSQKLTYKNFRIELINQSNSICPYQRPELCELYGIPMILMSRETSDLNLGNKRRLTCQQIKRIIDKFGVPTKDFPKALSREQIRQAYNMNLRDFALLMNEYREEFKPFMRKKIFFPIHQRNFVSEFGAPVYPFVNFI